MDNEFDARLTRALRELPRNVFDKVKETVDSDQTLLVGRWMAEADTAELLGCLMCDGLTVCEPAVVREALPYVSGMKYSGGHQKPILMKFYDIEDWFPIQEVAQSFDEWAYHHRYQDERMADTRGRSYDVLRPDGREALRSIFNAVATERTARA